MAAESWRRNLAALAVAQVVTQLAFSFALPLTPLYVRTLGVSDTVSAARWAGLISAASAVTLTITQPIWGAVADRWGHKPMVVRAMVGGSLTVMLQGLADSPEHLLGLRLLQGMVVGSVFASNALIATATPKERLGFALGVMQVGMLAGTAVGPLGGGIVADSFGFRSAFVLAGGLMLVGASIVIVFCHEQRIAAAAAPRGDAAWRRSLALLGQHGLPLLIGVIFLIQLGTVIVMPVLSLFIAELSGDENAASAAGVILAAGAAASAASALILGHLGDRFGQRIVLPVCLLGAAVAYVPQAMVQEAWQLMALRIALGVCLGGMMPSANALVARLVPPERRGTAFGLTATASALANAVGPLAGATFATQWGLRSVFIATGSLYGLACAWASLGLLTRPVTTEAPDPETAGRST